MTLTFTQENGLYVAEFEATAPFSIHLERPRGGFINMLQRSVDSGTFVAVKNFNPNYNATQVIDADCGQGAVYPKWIRLESAVEPSVAEVTFEDEQSGGGAGESVSKYIKGVEYYAVDYDKLVELGYDRTNTSVTTPSGMLNKAILPACGGKLSGNGESLILGPGVFDLYKGFMSSVPIGGIYYINVLQQSADDPSIWLTPTFKELITGQPIGGAFNEAFTEITEEEFYQGIEEA